MSAWRPFTARVFAFLLIYALSGLPMWSGLLLGSRRWETPLGTLLWALSIPVFLLAAHHLARWVSIDSFRGMGLLRHPGWGRNLALGMAVGLLEVGLILLLGWWTGSFQVTAVRGFSPWILLVPILNFGYVALSEELVYRGFLPKILPRSLSPVSVSLLTAGLFALAHLGGRGLVPDYMLSLFLSGLIYIAATLATGSLWFAIGLHWSFNLFNPLLIENDVVIAKEWLPGNPWASWTYALVRLGLLLALPLLLRALARRDEPSAGQSPVA